jgi:hypothetical protein
MDPKGIFVMTNDETLNMISNILKANGIGLQWIMIDSVSEPKRIIPEERENERRDIPNTGERDRSNEALARPDHDETFAGNWG